MAVEPAHLGSSDARWPPGGGVSEGGEKCHGKENGNYRDYRVYIGIIGFIGEILGFYWDNGKEHGNYYSKLGKFRV